MAKKYITYLIITIIAIILIKIVNQKILINFPIGLRHLYYQIVKPDDLYNPVVEEAFNFYNKGHHKTYKLKIKYYDFYEIGIKFSNKKITSKYQFNGKLMIEFLWKEKVISKNITDRILSARYADKSMLSYKSLTLFNFETPIKKKYKDISLRLTVLEADKHLEKHKDSARLYIAVSSSP